MNELEQQRDSYLTSEQIKEREDFTVRVKRETESGQLTLEL